MKILYEDSRNDLIAQGKRGEKEKGDGKSRFEKRVKSKFSTSVREYNAIDMNSVFFDGILTINIPVKGETANYLVRIKFGGFMEELQQETKRLGRVDLRTITRALINAFNRDDVYIHCSCLSGDTKIKLLDGTSPTIRELVDRYDSGEELYVYSVDDRGDFCPGKVLRAWQTGIRNEMIRVTLDNGEVIECTPEHLFMLRDGTYIPADALRSGVSLMPLYFSSSNGYETVKYNSTGKYHSVYKVVTEKLKQTEIEEASLRAKLDSTNMRYDVAIHHIDFNKLNNYPENLRIMTGYEHWMYHAEEVGFKRLWSDKVWSDNTKKLCSENMKKTNEKYREVWHDRRVQMGKASSTSYDKGLNSKSVIDRMHESRKQKMIQLNKDPYYIRKRLEGRIYNNMLKVINLGYELTEENYTMVGKSARAPRVSTAFSSFDEAVSYFKLNHKVKSIEYLTLENQPVYDIKLKNSNNFLVDAGVILHNCPDWAYRMAYWASVNDLNSGEPEDRPSDITNPKNDLGPGCKHVMLVLSNMNWLLKVASVINNYIKFFERNRKKEYADIIYPAIFGKPYEEPVQLSMDDTDELASDTDTIDTANIQGAVSGRFQRGNEYRFRPKETPPKNQMSIDDVEQQSEEPQNVEKPEESNEIQVSDEYEYEPDDDENVSISEIEDEANNSINDEEED